MVVIDATQSELLPEFFYALCRSFIVAKQIEAASFGSAQPQLTVGIIKGIKLPIPSLPEQKKIAQILSTWDKAITTTEQLLANSQQQKKALMQQLLTGKKRLLDKNGVRFSGEWKRVELGDLLDYQQPTPYLVESTEYSDDFPTPVLTAGKTFILGYTDEESGIFSEQLPAIIFDDFTTDSKFVDFPFKAKSSAMKILTSKDGVSIRFVYEAMQLLDFAVGGHQRHWISIYSRLVIPFPVKEEQQKIAAVLSTADQEISTLQQKLEALKQEKKALMQQLLTGKRRVNIN
ncbi:Type I restriction-modification system, specificity subunit S [Vibrio cholerae]|nr:Type I restriction-modification system, specificity subunit S [Vibrio cholerae]